MMRFAASVPGMDQMCCAESLLLLVVINFFCVVLKIFWCLIHTQNSIFFGGGGNIVFSYSCHVKVFLFYAVCVPLLGLNAIT